MSERTPEPAATSVPFALLFPRDQNSAPEEPWAVPDGRALIVSAFEDSANLWLFEAGLRHPRNLASPDRLTYDNWLLTQLLRGQGAEWGETPAFEDSAVDEGLAAIPPEADLFRDWPAVRQPAVQVLRRLMEGHGLTVQAASAMLYQKRPALAPVLDRFTRQACAVSPPPQWTPAALGQAIDAFAQLGQLPENRSALERIGSWLAERPALTQHLALSRVRILNLIAWRAVQAKAVQEPPATRKERRRAATDRA